jgi:hypothetical protein
LNYKNKQLIEKIMFESSLRYHTKKRKIFELMSGHEQARRHYVKIGKGDS